MNALGSAFLPQPQNKKAKASTLPFASYQPPQWPLAYFITIPLLLAIAVLYLEIQTPNLLISPFIVTILMLLFSMRLEPLQLALFAMTFEGVVFYSVRYLQPFDLSTNEDWMRLSLRCTGFLVVSTLAVLFSKYRCRARILQDETVAVIVAMPIPVVISDALGLVIFSNAEASAFLQTAREELQGVNYTKLFMSHMDEGAAMRDYIKLFQTTQEANVAVTGGRTHPLSLSVANGSPHPVEGRLICLGQGEARHMVTVLKV